MKILKYLLIIIIPNILIGQKLWTLQECVDRALEMNISIKKSQIAVSASDARPSISFQMSKLCN